MEAQELRIGNIIQVENDYEYIQGLQSTIAKCCLLGYDKGVWQKYEDIQPIHITKGWLLMFGFTQQSLGFVNLNYYCKNNIVYSLSDGNVELDNPNIALTQIKYVHQLQNIYFALTNEELTIKDYIKRLAEM